MSVDCAAKSNEATSPASVNVLATTLIVCVDVRAGVDVPGESGGIEGRGGGDEGDIEEALVAGGW